MKILVLLLALLVAFCFTCKDTLIKRELLAERQQLLADAAMQKAPTQLQTIAVI